MLKLRVLIVFLLLLSIKVSAQKKNNDSLKDKINISIGGGAGIPQGSFHYANTLAQIYGNGAGGYATIGTSYNISLKIPFKDSPFGFLAMFGYNANPFDLNNYLIARANYDYANESHISPSSGSNTFYNPYNPYYGLNKSNYQLYNGWVGFYLRTRADRLYFDFKILSGISIGRSPELLFYQNVTNVGAEQYDILSSSSASLLLDFGLKLGYRISNKIDVSIGVDYFITSFNFNVSENLTSPATYYSPSGTTKRTYITDCPVSLLNTNLSIGYSF